MCGILGFVGETALLDEVGMLFARDEMIHRGPDDGGAWRSDDGKVSLFHRRLSILDLSSLGHQPMVNQELGLVVVFNGEIYNFKELREDLIKAGYIFHTESDTEVLLVSYSKWGEDCLKYLNGMYAFAIYDIKNQKIFIARDRAGEKPFFYLHQKGSFFFSSELKSLLALPQMPRKIDAVALDCYLAMGFVPGENCILEDYKKLPAAHAMVYDLRSDKTRIWQYWSLPNFNFNDHLAGENVLMETLEGLLEDAVTRQMVSDVPVGILLSGGVDSSLITAMASRHSNRVQTFSVGFPGYGQFDETGHAKLISNYFGTNHTELVAQPGSAELLPALSYHFDEPIADSSMIPMWLLSHEVRKHCAVALGGDGADELFGGYSHYSRMLWMQHWFKKIPSELRHSIAKTSQKILPIGVKGRNYLAGIDVGDHNKLPFVASLFDESARNQLMRKFSNHPLVADDIRLNLISNHDDLLQRATRMDFLNYLTEDILVKVDRASMANSLEMRSPFLDYRIIEFAFSMVPSHLKATRSEKKILLKRVARKILPKNFDWNRKQGLSIPLAQWLKKGPFRELFWDTLTSKDCIFDQITIRNLLDGQAKGRNNTERLFALVQFELWRKTFSIAA